MDRQMKRILKKLYKWENLYYGENGEPFYAENALSEKEQLLLEEQGWKPNRIERFFGHTEILEKLFSLKQNPHIHESRMVETFIAGVGGSYLRGRSALSSWACFAAMPFHSYEQRLGYKSCWICGAGDKEMIVNDSEFQYCMYLGNAFADSPPYAYLNLRYLAEQKSVSPTAEDIKVFSTLLALLRTAPADETPTECEKRLRAEKFLGAPEHLRGILHSLSLVGVLPNQFVTLSHDFWSNRGEITAYERRLRNTKGRSDLAMPWAGWSGSLKIDEEKAEKLFGRYLKI